MHGVSHQYPITSGNTAKHILWEQPGCCFPIFSQSIGNSLPLDFHPVVCSIAWEMHDFFNEFLIALENAAKPIPWERRGM